MDKEKVKNLSIKDKESVILDFYKTAFCIDGDVEIVHKPMKYDCYIKLTDSKRGVFYVSTKSKGKFDEAIMSEELKPCPFCGNNARHSRIMGRRGVSCTECNAEIRSEEICEDNYDSVTSQWNTRHKDQRIADLEAELAKYRWIPVEERLPEKPIPVIAVRESGKTSVQIYYKSFSRWDTLPEYLVKKEDRTITYWMEIPELPKGESNDS